MKICLDPGHGGKDPGAVNGGFKEKDIVLNIALKLAEILRSNGIEVFLTRDGDIYDNVNEKAGRANRSNADLFISLHCNSAASVSANGTECLIYGYDGESDALAADIQNAIVQVLKTVDRGVKIRKDLAVLNSTKMPAVLVETAFISNSTDKEKLINKTNEFAMAIAAGIFEYLGMEVAETMEKTYNWTEEVPEWARPTVQKLLDKGYLKGNDKGELELTYSMLKLLVINDRAGLYGK